jgi:hypothetical protein
MLTDVFTAGRLLVDSMSDHRCHREPRRVREDRLMQRHLHIIVTGAVRRIGEILALKCPFLVREEMNWQVGGAVLW